MKSLEIFLDKYLGPIASYMSNSKLFGALSESFMRLTPVTLGASILMIIGNFPVRAWINYLAENGLTAHFNAVIGASTGVISILICYGFANAYGERLGHKTPAVGMIALASFFILMPQLVVYPEVVDGALTGGTSSTEAFSTLYTGGTGLFVALLTGGIVARIFSFLHQKNIVVKLPDSVPSNVSESLSPSIISGIIIATFFVVRVGMSFTAFGSVFTLIFNLIQQPLQVFVGHPVSIIFIFVIANLLWFFGIHPNMIYGAVTPVILANAAANITAFQNKESLPFLTTSVIMMACGNAFGGQGGTQGLVLSMFSAKSERYKTMRNLAGFPSIFNINEPLVFGMPIMMNPLFFIPMMLGPILAGATAWVLSILLKFESLNPTITLPWTTPAFVSTFIQGGFVYFLIAIACLFAYTIVWFPFFRVADQREYEQEQAS